MSVHGRLLDPDGFALSDAAVSFATRPLIRWPKKEPFGGTSFFTETLYRGIVEGSESFDGCITMESIIRFVVRTLGLEFGGPAASAIESLWALCLRFRNGVGLCPPEM